MIADTTRSNRWLPLMKGLLLATVFSLMAVSGSVAQVTDARIQAVYNVHFNGMALGNLNFTSSVKGKVYEMKTDTKLALPLLGSIFDSLSFRASSSSTGSLVGNEPHPSSYRFSYRAGDKKGAIDLTFRSDQVASVSRAPDKQPSASLVPVTPEHLRNVLDPMSAVMLFSRTGLSHRTACNRTIPIFDGEQRLNLTLSYKRAEKIDSAESGGYAGPVIVCRVRYVPLAGYKPGNDAIRYMADNKDIELWLMPLPNTRNYAPYRLVVLLPAGTAGADLAHFNIVKSNGTKIALVRQ